MNSLNILVVLGVAKGDMGFGLGNGGISNSFVALPGGGAEENREGGMPRRVRVSSSNGVHRSEGVGGWEVSVVNSFRCRSKRAVWALWWLMSTLWLIYNAPTFSFIFLISSRISAISLINVMFSV